jgi:hypothetical protein
MDQNRSALESALLVEVQAIEDIVTISKRAKKKRRMKDLMKGCLGMINRVRRKPDLKTEPCSPNSDSVPSFGWLPQNPYGV